jgi:hypothetical protein
MGAVIRSRLVVGLCVSASLAGVLMAAAVLADSAGFVPASGSPFSDPGATGSLALGDLNGDGNVDAVVSDPTASKLAILLGNGKGGLVPAPSVATGGTKPAGGALADLDGDGKLDAAVANEGSNNVSVLLGDGAGGFSAAPKSRLATGGVRPVSVLTGDFNGDAKLDVAVVNTSSADVSVLLGDGKGGLTLVGQPVATGGDHPRPAVKGDFNGDGKLDVAVANGSGNVSVLVGDGTGKLRGGGTSPFGLSPRALGAGDFNGDGRLDVAVANTTGAVTILVGDGRGALHPLPSAPVIPVGSAPASLAVADVDNDGKLDIAVANAGSGDLSVLLGNGAGGFIPAPGTPVSTGGSSPSSIGLGDLNGDRRIDLAAVNASSANLSVLLNWVPPAAFVSFPASPVVGEEVTFVYSSAGGTTSIDWDLNGDGAFDDAQGPSATRAFPAPGTYEVGLRVTDLDGLVSTSTRTITVGLPGSSRVIDSIPPAPSYPRLMAPFPIVRISGRTAPGGAHINLLEVLAPSGAKVTVRCAGKGCPFRRWRKTVGSKTLIVKALRGRFLRAGVRLEVRVYKKGVIGKYTRIVIRKHKEPARHDLCLSPGSSRPSACPST